VVRLQIGLINNGNRFRVTVLINVQVDFPLPSTPAERLGDNVTRLAKYFGRHWKVIVLYQMVAISLIFCLPHIGYKPGSGTFIHKSGLTLVSLNKRWGYDELPQSEMCYRQERTAILLSLFLGVFGADQFYAGNLGFGFGKLFTGGGLSVWALVDTILWIVGGHYRTPGC